MADLENSDPKKNAFPLVTEKGHFTWIISMIAQLTTSFCQDNDIWKLNYVHELKHAILDSLTYKIQYV